MCGHPPLHCFNAPPPSLNPKHNTPLGLFWGFGGALHVFVMEYVYVAKSSPELVMCLPPTLALISQEYWD